MIVSDLKIKFEKKSYLPTNQQINEQTKDSTNNLLFFSFIIFFYFQKKYDPKMMMNLSLRVCTLDTIIKKIII